MSRRAATIEAPNGAGAAVDSFGRATQDPTKNVLDLVAAGERRQDDLRKVELKGLRREMKLERAHAKDLRRAEAERLDAIRSIDQGQIQRTAEVQQGQAIALAQQVTTTADAFRAALVAALEPIQKDIQDLRKTQYEQQGQKAQSSESRVNWGIWVGIGLTLMGVMIAGAAVVLGGLYFILSRTP